MFVNMGTFGHENVIQEDTLWYIFYQYTFIYSNGFTSE